MKHGVYLKLTTKSNFLIIDYFFWIRKRSWNISHDCAKILTCHMCRSTLVIERLKTFTVLEENLKWSDRRLMIFQCKREWKRERELLLFSGRMTSNKIDDVTILLVREYSRLRFYWESTDSSSSFENNQYYTLAFITVDVAIYIYTEWKYIYGRQRLVQRYIELASQQGL